MLVLTRRLGEKIVIGDNIVVTVVAIEGIQIRIGIEAPPKIRIDREEVHEKRLAEAAAKPPEKSMS